MPQIPPRMKITERKDPEYCDEGQCSINSESCNLFVLHDTSLHGSFILVNNGTKRSRHKGCLSTAGPRSPTLPSRFSLHLARLKRISQRYTPNANRAPLYKREATNEIKKLKC